MFILFPYFCTPCLMRFLVSPADPPTTDVGTRCIKLAKAEEEKAETAEEERSREEKVWPEPAERLRPPVCSASALPDDAACPDGLKRLTSSKDLGPLLVRRIKWEALRVARLVWRAFSPRSLTEPFPWRTEVAGDADGVATFSRLYTLVEKMRTNEVKSRHCLGFLLPLLACCVLILFERFSDQQRRGAGPRCRRSREVCCPGPRLWPRQPVQKSNLTQTVLYVFTKTT